MANTLDNATFWLPSEFLTDGDIFMGKENYNKNGLNSAFGANFGFPTEFPYDFGSCGSSSVLSSPVESVVGSTETESDEEDFLGLTRQLARSTLREEITQKITFAPQNVEKCWVVSGSPQSTLSAVGSWSGRSAVSSPPTTPLGGNGDAWDRIYVAAGQIARLKMNGEGPPKGRGLLAPPRTLAPVHHPSPPLKNPNAGFYANQCLSHNFSQANHFEHARQDLVLQQQCSSIWGRPTREDFFSPQNQFQQQQLLMSENRGRILGKSGFEGDGRDARALGLPQSAWPPLQLQRQNNQNQQAQQGGSGMRALLLGESGVKRQCAGTGVFLPRRYGNPSDSRKKPVGCSTALLPGRVVQSLNKNFDYLTAQAQAQAQTRFSGALIPNYDTLMARRNALLAQQKRSLRPEGAMNHELCLPQEWTY